MKPVKWIFYISNIISSFKLFLERDANESFSASIEREIPALSKKRPCLPSDPSHPGLEGIRVSISHDGDYAMAFALVMQR